ncbi:plasmid mobilization protein [Flavobacterium aquiphilum]|uniref:plasmid mobilization protein n=1 Tax=Flavobacterium aquiphilum TaxID=3003261 RepID=UPI00248165E0|nr:plasmid mobilization relaxosome protein MobC [Flavobacterium aquiphilum]
MKKESVNRVKFLHLRLTQGEFETLNDRFKKSTCRKLSDYARKNLLQQPVVLKYRNESLDETMIELIQFRLELNAIGNNFNQAVKKLHTLSQIAEFRYWIVSYEQDKKTFFDLVATIQNHIEKLAQKWLQ